MNKEMNGANDKRTHDVSIVARRAMSINGVSDVISFDDTCLVLRTTCGEMTVEGREIRVDTLDTDKGIVSLEGGIDAIYYSDTDADAQRGFFGRRKK